MTSNRTHLSSHRLEERAIPALRIVKAESPVYQNTQPWPALHFFYMTDLGKGLVIFGAVILLAGVGFLIAGRMNLPIGRLPGDIIYRSKNTTFYFPLVTSIILSALLSAVLYLVSRFSAK